ncbi:MAG: hypothetical protein WA324_01495 [Bryobacteraceae bacterium]
MVKLRHLLPTLTLFSILIATGAPAQNSLTAIQDTVLNADGTPFQGTLIVTWNGFTAPSGGTIAPHSTSAQIYGGVLSILLVPTTTASAGAYYLATYNSSDGTTTWSETWQVPASSTPLTLNQVRVPQTGSGTGSTGTSGTSSGSISLPIPISDVSNLSTTLSTLSSSISTLTSQVSVLTVTPVFIDGETPGGTINGGNATFTLANAPSPATSLDLYRNGLVQSVGVDYRISGNTITFLPGSIPQTGDLLQAFYRAAGIGPAANFSDDESPAGTENGSNTTFTVSFAPSPVLSLRLYRNGLLLRQGTDYLLAGATITFAAAPQSTDQIVAYYRH